MHEFLFLDFIDVNANGQKHDFRREAHLVAYFVMLCYGRIDGWGLIRNDEPDKSDQYF